MFYTQLLVAYFRSFILIRLNWNPRFQFAKVNSTPEVEGMDMPDGVAVLFFQQQRSEIDFSWGSQ